MSIASAMRKRSIEARKTGSSATMSLPATTELPTMIIAMVREREGVN
jgi:hypothetical protein